MWETAIAAGGVILHEQFRDLAAQWNSTGSSSGPPGYRPAPEPDWRPPDSPLCQPGAPLHTLDRLAAQLTHACDLARIAGTAAAQHHPPLPELTPLAAQLHAAAHALRALASAAHLAVLALEPALSGHDSPAPDAAGMFVRTWFHTIVECIGDDVPHGHTPVPTVLTALLSAGGTGARHSFDRFPIGHAEWSGRAAVCGVLAFPEITGNVLGVPWELRIVANAISVRRAAQRERMSRRPWTVRTGRLDTMDRLRPDPVSGLLARREFIAFDPRGAGQMVELVGDPSTAEGLAVYVPGTGTNLDMSHVNTEVADNWVSIGEGRIACLIFLGGTFPQNMWVESGDPVFTHSMSPRLVDTGWDVQAHLRRIGRDGRSARPLPVTVIGHSFGGAVVGDAETHGLYADRVVYVASPNAGPGVRSASQWRNSAPAVQRFSLTAPGDPIELTQTWAGLRYPDSSHADVMDGVQRLDTGFYDSGEVVFGTRGHGGVLDREADAFWQVARVVVGAPTIPYVARSISARGTQWWARNDGRLLPMALAQLRGQRTPWARDAPIVIAGPGQCVSRDLPGPIQ